MRVLVTGGTGFVGRYLCAELVDRGHEVTALARDPGGADLPDGVETATGDVTAYDSIEGHFEGQDAVVNLVALTAVYKPPGGDEMHEVVHLGGTENCVKAAEEHGVDRFVQMSALGADPDGPTHYVRAKGKAERVVRESDLDWVVVRPSVIFGDDAEFIDFTLKLTPPLVAFLPGGGRRTRFQPVFAEEVASILADCVEDDAHVGEVYEIGGPEVLTLADVARLARRSRGHPVTILPVPMAVAGAGLAVMDVIPGVPMGRDQYRSLKFDNTTAENDVGAFGFEESDMTTLASYLGVEENERVR